MISDPPSLAEVAEETDRADALIAALADDQTRQVFQYVYESDERVFLVDGLVDSLLDAECEPEDRDRLAIRLHHVTLPKMADVGLIEYDARSHTVRY
jgi:predicted transcriptional regulator